VFVAVFLQIREGYEGRKETKEMRVSKVGGEIKSSEYQKHVAQSNRVNEKGKSDEIQLEQS